MRSTEKVWSSAEVRRAGWISALTNLALFTLLARSFRSVHSAFDGLLYPIFAIALGVVAVGVLNWRHWQGFRQSMAASFQAVLVIFKITVGTLILAALVATAWKGPVAFLVVLFYVGAALLLYSWMIFAMALGLAWGGGAFLYGLLLAMRYAARIGQARSGGDELKPRPLLSVSH